MAKITALPGPIVDLMHEGVRDVKNRGDVVRAVRAVMFSAHHHQQSWATIQRELTDEKRNKLAVQIATGRRGSKMNPAQVTKFLHELWDQTANEVASRPAWTADDVLDFLEFVREVLDNSEVPDRDRAVMDVVLDLANQYRTARVAAPVHVVAEKTGLTKPTAHRALMGLCDTGDWLALARRGSKTRSNLYNVAPALRETYTGALRPMSHDQPTSHQPTSHEAVATLQLPLTAEEQAVVLAALTEHRAARNSERETRRVPAGDNVVPIRRAGGAK